MDIKVELTELIEGYKDVLMFSIDRDFRYVIFNSAFKSATEAIYGTKVLQGGNMLESITIEEEKKKAQRNCEKALKGNGHRTVEVYGEFEKKYFETRYYPRYAKNKEVIGVSVMSFDVTDRELAKKQIQDLISDLESFTYSVSHDLRAPLRAITGFSEILSKKSRGKLDSKDLRYLETIQKSASNMGKLIDDLLEFSRIGRAKVSPTPLNMTEIAKECLETLSHEPELPKAEIIIHDLPSATCDPDLIKHVYGNLISNALKYSGKKKNPKIEIGCERSGENHIFYVKDNGAGFDARYADKLFQVFERLHDTDEFQGTGIGLALAHRIIQKHHGKIWAESELGKGATFYFSLPGQMAQKESQLKAV